MRFEPDTWLEALLRPIAMAAPDANVYVEIMAPDFRFVFVIALLAVLAVLWVRARRPGEAGDGGTRRRAVRPAVILLAATAAAFAAWMTTTANGRYFVPGLLLVGPLCIALVALLPLTQAFRLTLALVMVALQAFAVQQSAPWGAWTMVQWNKPPYFDVEVPAELRAEPATYVTLSAISYSLLAPLFHPESRWISLHNAPAPNGASPDARRTGAFLSHAQPGRLMLLAPAVQGLMTQERLPDANASAGLDAQLSPYGLALARPQSCRFLPSRGLAEIGLGEKTMEQRANSGFWVCHLTRIEAAAANQAARGQRFGAVFGKLEAQCPSLFPPGGDDGSVVLPNGEMRSYLRAEMKAYVYDNGEVYYKYYRALNPVLVGKTQDVLSGTARVDCAHVRGRSSQPWDRDI